MKHFFLSIKDFLISVGILIIAFFVSLLLEGLFKTSSLVPSIFALAVFLISLATEGYVYGIVSSLVCVLAVNFAFAFPYFMFNFGIPENLVSAVIMLIVTILTSALTTKVKAQEKLRAENEIERMRGNLLRGISHDLRTPLTTIYGSSSAIIDNYDSLSRQQQLQLLNGMKEDAEWLIRMVENLLSVTRIDGQGVELVKTPVVLEELIDTVLIKFQKRYPNQKVITKIPDEFISIPMDAVLIDQVLGNLLENAVQHATGMTELSLSVWMQGHQAVFQVSDNGCGIPKEQLGHIFNGYSEKKDLPVDRQKRSMGIGLSVCATIIKAHGGRIEADNDERGGAIFQFFLDMDETEDVEEECHE